MLCISVRQEGEAAGWPATIAVRESLPLLVPRSWGPTTCSRSPGTSGELWGSVGFVMQSHTLTCSQRP